MHGHVVTVVFGLQEPDVYECRSVKPSSQASICQKSA